MKFSIITVSYNAGSGLAKTVNSVLRQSCGDYEILIKDGLSTDGSVAAVLEEQIIKKAVTEQKVHIFSEQDRGVYDAMNQALRYASGDYFLFLNCGDILHDDRVLEKTASVLEETGAKLVYGDTFCEQTQTTDYAAPAINGFTCYRNIPCHQSCFYARELFQKKQYDSSLKIRADYDHFLWCFYQAGIRAEYLKFVVSDYEGGGISERSENRLTDQKEHEIVIHRYMSEKEILGYKIRMALTLAPLRRWAAENRLLAGLYQGLKKKIYHHA